MNVDNVYSFTVQRQNSSEVAPGKSPCVKIKFIKDESIRNRSRRYKIGVDNASDCSGSTNGDDKPDCVVDDVSGASSPLSICPIYGRDGGGGNGSDDVRAVLVALWHMVDKKDGQQRIFAHPVTEEQAPNYRAIIERPIDLETIRHKIDAQYRSVVELVDDLVLMCRNALVYNTCDTVYYKMAAQMLNYVRRTFSREAINRLVMARLSWTRGLTDAEMGEWDGCLERLKAVQREIAPPANVRASQRAISQKSVGGSKRKGGSKGMEALVAKKSCVAKNLDTASPESEIDDSYLHNPQSEISDEDADDEEEEDDDAIDEVLFTAQKAALAARHRLQQSLRSQTRPVVYLDRVGDHVVLVNEHCDQLPDSVSADMQAMVTRVGTINVEQLLGENDRTMALVGQLCQDPNEAVSLTTSKPLEPYSCAEQAVLVETFGDVVTAEFACNMHNFVLDLPPNSAALNIVKNKLNTATNYLTYGVDQIIIKKLRAAAAEAPKI